MAAKTRSSPATSPRAVWDALRSAGATPVQAAGIMGNWIAESGLNPEASAVDSNGKRSYGLAQWNAGSYPNAASLVTGRPEADLAAQVTYFAQTGGFRAATGSTPQQVAASVASRYERCATCQSGGAQSKSRQAQAATVAGWASSGNWPASASGATDTAQLSSAAQAQSSATCLWSLGGGTVDLIVYHQSLPSFCMLSKSQARAIEAIALMGTGINIMMFGLQLLFQQTGAYQRLEGNVKALAGAVPKV